MNQYKQELPAWLQIELEKEEKQKSMRKIRGLLCWNCNIGLGYFRDNIKNLKNAINYLKENGK